MSDLDTDFAGDDGTADPALRAAIAEHVASPTLMTAAVLLDLLTTARVLVPVVAVADGVEVDDAGLAHDKDSHMRSVEFQSADGRRALLAFTGTDSLARWDPSARPVPRRAHIAAQGVLEQDLDALILDIGGPVPVAIGDAMLVRLAVSANHARYLEAALEDACDALESLAGVGQADWSMSEREIVVVLQVEEPDPDLGSHVAGILQDPNLAVVLDRELTVRIADLGADGGLD